MTNETRDKIAERLRILIEEREGFIKNEIQKSLISLDIRLNNVDLLPILEDSRLELIKRLLKNRYIVFGDSNSIRSDTENRINALNQIRDHRVSLDSSNTRVSIDTYYGDVDWLNKNRHLYDFYCNGYHTLNLINRKEPCSGDFKDFLKRQIKGSPYFSEERKLLKEHLREMNETPYDTTKVKP